MNAIFLDTVGLLALWNASDQWHDAATEAFRKVTGQPRRLTTTSYVLLECGNAAARRPFRRHVSRLRQMLEQRGELVLPTHEDWTQAWAAYERGEAGEAGIVDHVSFVVMRRLEITDALYQRSALSGSGFYNTVLKRTPRSRKGNGGRASEEARLLAKAGLLERLLERHRRDEA